MFSADGKTTLNSKIKIKINVNELADTDKLEADISEMVVKYLIEQCGAGNFVYEADVQY
jgi:hypothetical protein